ncbi:MAG: T9SS type A sorting domain-containing protein, partial [Sphingobacteriales bacterium]
LVYIENGISVQGNTVTNAGNQGIFLNYINRTGTTRGTIANNMIGGGFRIANLALGLQINMSNYLDVYYNSVNVDNGTTGIALYVPNAHSTFLRVQNNSFAYTGNGTGGRALHANDASYNFETLNHNNYYSTGGEFVYYNRGFRANLAALQASVANGVAPHDANSMSANPMYMSSTNLHLNPLSPLANNAMAITSVTTDIDGDQRDTTPTIGADELSVPQPRMAKTETALTVYPNPFTDKLSVQVEQTEGTVQVVITDMTGRTVFTSTPVVSSGIVAVRPLNLLQGVYILQVTQTTGTTQSRIVKQ